MRDPDDLTGARPGPDAVATNEVIDGVVAIAAKALAFPVRPLARRARTAAGRAAASR